MRLLSRLTPSVLFCGAILLASVLLPLPRDGKILSLPSPCPFFHITGLPCPGCGLTRSFVSCAHGQISKAFLWHPLGPLLFLGTLLYVIGAVAGVSLKPKQTNLLIGVTGIALFTFWVLRLGGVFPIPAA